MQIRLIRLSRSLTADNAREIQKTKDLIKNIDAYQLSLTRPKNFDSQDPGNYIKEMEKGFETLCATLEELGVHRPKSLTVFEFYTRVEYFKKKRQGQGKQTTSAK